MGGFSLPLGSKSSASSTPTAVGKAFLFIYPVEEVIRIRTRERSQDAMMYPGDIDERKGGRKDKKT